MKNFIKSPTALKKLPFLVTRLCMEAVVFSYILLVVHYIILARDAGNSVLEARYLIGSSEYLVASAVLSLVLGLLFDLFLKKEL